MNYSLLKFLSVLSAFCLGLGAVPLTGKPLTGVAVGSFLLCVSMSLSYRLPRIAVASPRWVVVNAILSAMIFTSLCAIYCIVVTSEEPEEGTAWFVVGLAASLYCGILSLIVSGVSTSIAAVLLLIAGHLGLPREFDDGAS